MRSLLSHFLLSEGCSPCKGSIHDRAALQFVQECFLPDSNRVHVEWMPDYGCAVVGFSQIGCAPTAVRHLHLVGLDGWHFAMHSTPRERQVTAACTGFSVVAVGSVEEATYNEFWTQFRLCLANRTKQAKKGEKKKTQRTPAFIAAILQEARTGTWTDPRGGFTEIGRHTGSERRGTCWPLVEAVFRLLLSHSGVPHSNHLGDMVMAYFDLWLLEGQLRCGLPVLTESTGVRRSVWVDCAMQMLQSAVRNGAALADNEHPMPGFEARVVTARGCLSRTVETAFRQEASQAALPALKEGPYCSRNPVLQLPEAGITASDAVGLDAARQRSEKNLSWLPLLSPDSSISDARLFLKHPRLQHVTSPGDATTVRPSDIAAAQLVQQSIERVFFMQSNRLEGLESALPQPDVDALEEVVESYRMALETLLRSLASVETGEGRAFMRAELLSRELLVVWIAYCLSHQATKAQYPPQWPFGVSLRWQDMRHLALSDEMARIASLRVSRYLHDNATAWPVFSLGDQDPTFDMATAFASKDSTIRDLWQAERGDTQRRMDEHWALVLSKQQMVRNLRAQVHELEAKIEVLKKQVRHCEDCQTQIRVYGRYRYDCPACQSWQDEMRGHESKLKLCRIKLRTALASPRPVFQPLPQHPDAAFCVLFFLHMPAHFRALSRLSVMAQQMLVPHPHVWALTGLSEEQFAAVTEAVRCKPPETSWLDYYNQWTRQDGGSATKVELHSMSVPPSAAEVQERDVMAYVIPSDGIWYPDSLKPIMMWEGGGFDLDRMPKWKYFNPLAPYCPSITVDYFTERFAGPDGATLQWTLPQHGARTALTRGNQGIANQHLRPSWLSKTEFLSFTALRAWPHRQLRALCVALHTRALPLGHPSVLVLVRQLLYHTGDIAFEGAAPVHVWQAELREGDLGAALHDALASLAEDLHDAPRNYAMLLPLIEAATYLAQSHAPASAVVRRCAEIAEAWGEQLEPQIATAIPKAASSLQAKQRLFFLQAVVAYRAVALDAAAVESICTLMVRAQSLRLFECPTGFDEALVSLALQARAVMHERISEILPEVQKAGGAVLTAAVRCVVHNAPRELEWRRLLAGTDTACFEAVAGDQLYSVNLLSGVVLLNGLPPAQLPESVTEHPLYKRTFREWMFQSYIKADGTLATVRSFKGCFYTFASEAEGLVIMEHPEQGPTLRLLDHTDGRFGASGCDLPVRLRELYSHWYCAAQRTIVLRPKYFVERDAVFLLQSIGPSDGPAAWQCRRVPKPLRAKPWTELLNMDSLDRLVLLDAPPLTAILAKFERAAYTHMYITPTGRLKVSLPRYGLEFEHRSDGHFHSLILPAYRLAGCQQMPGLLWGFQQYLVLQHIEHGDKDMLILIPDGEVIKTGDRVALQGPEAPGAARVWRQYPVHRRFRHLTAGDLRDRLQLAALHAATSMLLPEPASELTGCERAMELVRQSWLDRPLRRDEQAKLGMVVRHSQLSPGLVLLCRELEASTLQLRFLHGTRTEPKLPPSVVEHAMTEYQTEAHPTNARQALSELEELRVMGHNHRPRPVGRRTPPHGSLPPLPRPPHVPLELVEEVEADIAALVRLHDPATPAAAAHSFPLGAAQGDGSCLAAWMVEELQASWDTYHSLPVAALGSDLPSVRAALRMLQARVTDARQAMEAHALQCLQRVPSGPNRRCGTGTAEFEAGTEATAREEAGAVMASDWRASGVAMRRAAHLALSVRPLDLLGIACDGVCAARYNPFLSADARDAALADVHLWLKLCVLEDRLGRLRELAARETVTAPLLRELQVRRTWDAAAYPEWLVFEAETGLQIRPQQFVVAKGIMDHCAAPDGPGPIVQLNVGEGKTRVILPMLVLHWTRRRDTLVRLHFLWQLLPEAFDYLHQALCASTQNVRFLQMPFHRSVSLSVAQIEVLRVCMEHCQRSGGVLCVAPEHRQSLQLKRYELYLRGEREAVRALEALAALPYRDVLDESDEVLRHNNQLIYAVGSPMPLPAGPSRWNAVQALLAVMNSDPGVASILAQPGVSRRGATGTDGHPEAFRELRLLPGEAFDAVHLDLLRCIATALIHEPPYEMQWLRRVEGRPALRDRVVEFVTIAEASALDGEELAVAEWENVLALRGLLAYGLLVHCLQRRHMVNYGIARARGQKRIAVPFRASNTPAPRAEFRHPNIALLYTTLAYYYDGLSLAEVRQAFEQLLQLGPNAQDALYREWFAAGAPGLRPEDRGKIDSVLKVDLSNALQLELLVRTYRRNMLTINFWLNNCVLPSETLQYPHSLVATSWHLAANARREVAGFSGTKDSELLLPLAVRQTEPGDAVLRGTDGKMLQCILDNSAFLALDLASAEAQTGPDAVLNAVRDTVQARTHGPSAGVSALIDAGGLMAGAANADVAVRMLGRLPSSAFRGVVYFDDRRGEWVVRDFKGQEWPKRSSPIHERDAFVYFDESRCRGADMVLRPEACAVLTLGPKMGKDKFMQAAGGMRQLGSNQRLVLVGLPDVETAVRQVSQTEAGQPTEVSHVLRWATYNTAQAVARGLLEWAVQGGHFHITTEPPEVALVPETVHLPEMYGSPNVQELVTAIWPQMQALLLKQRGSRALADGVAEQLEAISGHLAAFGGDISARHATLDEECERELEKELELEVEVETQVPQQQPRRETPWDFEALFRCRTVEEVPAEGVQRVTEFLAGRVAAQGPLGGLCWSDRVYCTANFALTIEADGPLDEYLWPVDAVVYFPADGALLLVSEFEADALLGVWWGRNAPLGAHDARRPALFTLCHMPGLTVTRHVPLQLPPASSSRWPWPCDRLPEALATAMLLNGETRFVTGPLREAVLDVLTPQNGLAAAQTLVQLRGVPAQLLRSDLEDLCRRLEYSPGLTRSEGRTS